MSESIKDKLMPVALSSDDRDRITARFTVVHQEAGMQPVAVEGGYSRFLEHSEQAFVRNITLSAEEGWVDLDLGWVKHPGLLAIENRVGKGLRVQLSEEQKTYLATQIVQLTLKDDEKDLPARFQIRPSGFFLADLVPGGPPIRMRCLVGEVKLTLSITPY